MRLFTLLTSYGLVSIGVAQDLPDVSPVQKLYENLNHQIEGLEKHVRENRVVALADENEIANFGQADKPNYTNLNLVMRTQSNLVNKILSHPQLRQVADQREKLYNIVYLAHPPTADDFQKLIDFEVKLREMRAGMINDLAKVERRMFKQVGFPPNLAEMAEKYLSSTTFAEMDTLLANRLKDVRNLLISYAPDIGLDLNCDGNLRERRAED